MKTNASVALGCLHLWGWCLLLRCLWASHSVGQSDDRHVLMSPSFRVCCHSAVKGIATLKNQTLPQGPTVDRAVFPGSHGRPSCVRPLVAWPSFLRLSAEHMAQVRITDLLRCPPQINVPVLTCASVPLIRILSLVNHTKEETAVFLSQTVTLRSS